jgi:hypothetical protein
MFFRGTQLHAVAMLVNTPADAVEMLLLLPRLDELLIAE